MAEVLVVFDEPIPTDAGLHYARVCGGIADDGLWEGWVEFLPGAEDPSSEKWIRSARETEQPNLDDLKYWASGLSVAYLQGAFTRASDPASPPITHTDILATTVEHHVVPRPVPRGG